MRIRSQGTFCLSLLLGAATSYAADVWNAKDPSQWSDQDVNRILNDSPWARQVNVSAGGPTGARQRSGAGRMGGGSPNGGVSGPMGGGFPGVSGRGVNGYPDDNARVGRPGGGQVESHFFPVTVRWESALPIRLARHQSSNSETAGQSDKDYVIAVAGMPLQSAGDRSRDPDQVREELMEMTVLDRRGKTPLRPSDVKLDSGDGQVRFIFHRDPPIDLDDREVTFQTSVGQMKLEKKFKLKDMEYQGKLEL